VQIELLVFDLDGTLIDSKLDLALSVNATRAQLGMPPLADEIVFSYVGNGAPVLIRKAIGEHAGDEQFERSLEYFLSYYRQHMLDNTRLYPGAREALDRMRGAALQLAVLTNKPVRFSRDLLRGLGVADHFAAVYGGNSFETKKPHPEGLQQVMADLAVSPERTLVVGDSGVDIRTARNAGAWSCGVTYGFQPETFAQEPPDFLVHSLAELAGIVTNGQLPFSPLSDPNNRAKTRTPAV
jgi:phosphoglycolate phosphatase